MTSPDAASLGFLSFKKKSTRGGFEEARHNSSNLVLPSVAGGRDVPSRAGSVSQRNRLKKCILPTDQIAAPHTTQFENVPRIVIF